MANDRYPDAGELARRRSSNPEHFAPERPSETSPRGPGRVVSRTVPPAPRPAAVLVRLAERLGKDPEALAAELPPETLRRLRHPLIEDREEDGTRTFRHDHGIVEGPRALLKI